MRKHMLWKKPRKRVLIIDKHGWRIYRTAHGHTRYEKGK